MSPTAPDDVEVKSRILVMMDVASSITTPPWKRGMLVQKLHRALIADCDFPKLMGTWEVDAMLQSPPRSIPELDAHRRTVPSASHVPPPGRPPSGEAGGALRIDPAAEADEAGTREGLEAARRAAEGGAHVGGLRILGTPLGMRGLSLPAMIGAIANEERKGRPRDVRRRAFEMLAGCSFLEHQHRREEVEHYLGMPLGERRRISESFRAMGGAERSGGTAPVLFRVLKMNVSARMKHDILQRMRAIERGGRDDPKFRDWFETMCGFPFGVREIPNEVVRRLSESVQEGAPGARREVASHLKAARARLDEAIHGQAGIKDRVVEILAARISNPSSRMGSVIGIQGPPGVGKTRIAVRGIADSLGMPCEVIALGSESDSMLLKGSYYAYEGSGCGCIASALTRARTTACVLCFDELDKVCSSRHGDEVSNCLIHLTDPEQNKKFRDRYLGDVDIDLSACVMVFSFNDASKVNPVLLDRLHVVRMNAYGRDDKREIARSFLLPEMVSDIRGDAADPMPEGILDRFIEEFSMGTGGMRSLKHALERACLKKNAMGALLGTGAPSEVTWLQVLEHMIAERDEELTRDIGDMGMMYM